MCEAQKRLISMFRAITDKGHAIISKQNSLRNPDSTLLPYYAIVIFFDIEKLQFDNGIVIRFTYVITDMRQPGSFTRQFNAPQERHIFNRIAGLIQIISAIAREKKSNEKYIKQAGYHSVSL